MNVLVLHYLHGYYLSDLHPIMDVLVFHCLHSCYPSDLRRFMNVLVLHCLHGCNMSDLRPFMNILVLHCLHGYNMSDHPPFINLLTTLTSEVTRASESETAEYIKILVDERQAERYRGTNNSIHRELHTLFF